MNEISDEQLVQDVIIYSGGPRIIWMLCERFKAAKKRISELEYQLERAKHPEHYAMIDAYNRGRS